MQGMGHDGAAGRKSDEEGRYAPVPSYRRWRIQEERCTLLDLGLGISDMFINRGVPKREVGPDKPDYMALTSVLAKQGVYE